MDVQHSRRILMIGAPESGVLEVVQRLTGSAPLPHEGGSTAGLKHEWNVQTQYYKAKVPMWIDEVVDVEAWRTEFLKPEAKEVVEAVGAWVYCFRMPQDSTQKLQIEQTLQAVFEVSEEHLGYSAHSLMLAVALPNDSPVRQEVNIEAEEWEDICLQSGFEVIEFGAQGTNEFGEKVGLERLKEALEANEWEDTGMSDNELDLDDLELEDDDDGNNFARDEAEMTAEIFGLKAALARDDLDDDDDDVMPQVQQETQVEDLDRLMGKLMAVKENSAGLPEAQRRKMAAKAVREVMKDTAS